MNIQRVPNTTAMQGIDSALAGLDNGTFVHIRQAARATGTVKGEVKMMEIRWMNSDVNRPSGIDEGRRRR